MLFTLYLIGMLVAIVFICYQLHKNNQLKETVKNLQRDFNDSKCSLSNMKFNYESRCRSVESLEKRNYELANQVITLNILQKHYKYFLSFIQKDSTILEIIGNYDSKYVKLKYELANKAVHTLDVPNPHLK